MCTLDKKKRGFYLTIVETRNKRLWWLKKIARGRPKIQRRRRKPNKEKMRVAFGVWVGGTVDPGNPADERVEYVTEDLDASPDASDLEQPLSEAFKFVSELNPNDVVVLLNPKRVSLIEDPMAVVATLMRTKCHAMIAASRNPSDWVPVEIADALPDLPTSKARSKYPDASALVIGFAGAIKAVLGDRALRKTEQRWEGSLGAWDRFWTLAFLKSASRKKSRPYPKLALDYFEELGTCDSKNGDACFLIRTRMSARKKILAGVGIVTSIALVTLLVLGALHLQRKQSSKSERTLAQEVISPVRS